MPKTQKCDILTLNSGQFMLSTQLIKQNYPVILSQQCSTMVSLETYPLFLFVFCYVDLFLDDRHPCYKSHNQRFFVSTFYLFFKSLFSFSILLFYQLFIKVQFVLHVAKLSLESDTSAGENRTILIFKLMKGRCDPSENINVVVFIEF